MSSNIPEPCDRCPSKDMVWCQSNGCSTEEDIKYIEEEFFVNDGWLKSVKLPYRVNEDGSKTWIKTGDLEEEEEKWDIRPAGDFPDCAYCENICKIITVDTCRKFSTNCGKCPNSIEKELYTDDNYWCVDCGKNYKWIKGISYAGNGVNSYHCGKCDKPKWWGFNKRCDIEAQEDEVFNKEAKVKYDLDMKKWLARVKE